MVVTEHDPEDLPWEEILRITGFSCVPGDDLPGQFSARAMKAGIMEPGQGLLNNLFSRSIVLMQLSCMGLEQLLRTVYNRCSIQPSKLYNLVSMDEDDDVRLATTRCPLKPANPNSDADFHLTEETVISKFTLLNLIKHTIDVLNIPRPEVSRNQFMIVYRNQIYDLFTGLFCISVFFSLFFKAYDIGNGRRGRSRLLLP